MILFLQNFNSRANEFAADKYANDLGMGPALASGLIKISIGTYIWFFFSVNELSSNNDINC